MITWLAALPLGLLLLSSSPKRKRKKKLPKGDKVLRWKALVNKACKKYPRVKKSLVYATMKHESGGNPRARSTYKTKKGKIGHAYGLMQIIPSTGRMYGLHSLSELYDPELNIEAGVHLLSDLLKKYKGDLERVLAAYYGGPGNAKRPFKPGIQKYINTSKSLMERYQDV